MKKRPRRPLSAYNRFWKDERLRILESGVEKTSFENLAKTIEQRWASLDKEEIVRYKELANEDMKRYKKEMEAYLTKKGKRKLEEMNSM